MSGSKMPSKNRMKAKRPSRRRTLRRKMYGGAHPGHIYVFFHIYCNSNTLEIVRDQATKIIFSGLYDDVTTIFCYLAGNKEYVTLLKTYITSLPKKFVVKDIGVDDITYERFTLTKIKNHVQENDKFLYIHTKGVTRVQEKSIISECTYLWRNYMEYHLIRHYKKCLEKLNTHDVVGAIYKTLMVGPHFSGNFWWSTGAYFKRLSREHSIGEFYTDPEVYIFKGLPNFAMADDNSIHDRYCLYKNPMFPKFYMDKPVN